MTVLSAAIIPAANEEQREDVYVTTCIADYITPFTEQSLLKEFLSNKQQCQNLV